MQGAANRIPAYVAGAAMAAAVGAAFWIPSARAAHGWFPSPLDDVYIHFDFARSLAQGAPFEWIPGNGYSSGETSPLYALLLAVGWLVGFRGWLLGPWAAVLAIAGLASFVRSIRELARPAPAPVAWAAAALTLSVGIVDWTLVSGMEVAVFAGVLGPTLRALERTRAPAPGRGGLTRASAQWRLGLFGALLVAIRPEAAILVAVFAIVAARGVLRRSAIAALVRVGLPGVVIVVAVFVANRLATGSIQSAGAQLKLLSSNPYLSDSDRARAYLENLVTFAIKGVASELGHVPFLRAIVPCLVVASFFARARRPLASACVAGAMAWTLLVSWNGASPFHNFRYYAPALLLVLAAAAVGAGTLATAFRSRRRGAAIALVLLGCAIAANASRFPAQVTLYRRAVANIRDQQIVAGTRLGALAEDARVMVNDAGAIPYVSGRRAVDALGLGGYRRLPFAQAAVYGEAATIELVERLPPSERPTHLAVYPHWFGALSKGFGREIDRVTISDNVICAGPTKVIYEADWSVLGRAPAARDDVVDELDVADVVSEGEHAYRAPLPEGHASFDVRLDAHGESRFDGGREIPEGKSESFAIVNSGGGRGRVVVRIDARAGDIEMRTKNGTTTLTPGPVVDGAWREATGAIEGMVVGDRIELTAARGSYRDYHVWILRAF